ncbi:LapA_dom domain-containing protein [Nitrospira tepida]|uniref:LapA_dom domain-containing protein n=1 Tax=Nitrospira tepida TaxID=2973512 RepID=A0AA86N2R0_9BACT|nr:LapA family protein [Nitrospira tepida]CAI4033758.1 LapA_dom domain-containing protein [Nitrospira tepida]
MPSLVIALILLLVAAAFALQNTEVVTVQFLLWDYQASLVLIILGATLLGTLLAFLASIGPRLRRAKELRRLESLTKNQEARIRELEAHLQRTAPSAQQADSGGRAMDERE